MGFPCPPPQVEMLLYFCESATGVCHMQGVILTIPLSPSPTSSAVETTVHYTPELPKTS